MKTKIEELQSSIAKAQEEIQAIQEACTHENYEVKMYKYHPYAAQFPQRICSNCTKRLDGITSEESWKCILQYDPDTTIIETSNASFEPVFLD